MTQAAAPQQEFSYLGKVYCAASGQWAFRLYRDGEELVRGAGFEDEVEAAEACADHFPCSDFPIRLVADPDFDLSAPVLEPLPSQTCPQCHGVGSLRLWGLDGHIECPNCYGHGEVFQLDDEAAE